MERPDEYWELVPCRCAGNHAAEAHSVDRHSQVVLQTYKPGPGSPQRTVRHVVTAWSVLATYAGEHVQLCRLQPELQSISIR